MNREVFEEKMRIVFGESVMLRRFEAFDGSSLNDEYRNVCVNQCWIFYQALASQAQQSQWISVEERLPDTGDYVFVYMPNNNYLRIGIDCWQMQKESPLSFSSQTVDIGMGWDDNEFEYVSHWMPIPPAPEGGE